MFSLLHHLESPRKPWRKTDEDFENYIHSLEETQPDLVLMHDGPDVPENGNRGSPRIREAINDRQVRPTGARHLTMLLDAVKPERFVKGSFLTKKIGVV